MREPNDRATLEEIMSHKWLNLGSDGGSPTPLMPLVSREDITDEQNSYIVQRMVEGKIASKDDILR